MTKNKCNAKFSDILIISLDSLKKDIASIDEVLINYFQNNQTKPKEHLF